MIWTKSEEELIEFLNELNNKHTSIKFEFKYLRHQIEFLDTLVHINGNNHLQTTLTGNLLIARSISKSAYPSSLKNSTNSQDLQIKRKCSASDEFNKHSRNLLQLKKKTYHHVTLKEQTDKARVEDRTLLSK